MLFNIVLLLLLILIWHNYANTNRHLEATASAIRDIWSGTCGTCRRDLELTAKPDLPTTSRTRPGPSIGCVCASCPCELIENFLGSCAPGQYAFTSYVNLLADYYYNLLKAITNGYNSLTGALESTPLGQEYQPIDSQEAFKDHEKNLTLTEEDSEKDDKVNINRSHDLVNSEPASSSGCSRCIEQGNLCRPGCPKGPKSKENNVTDTTELIGKTSHNLANTEANVNTLKELKYQSNKTKKGENMF